MKIKDIDGLPVIDAKKPLRIIVTVDDIGGASRKDPRECAIARACARQLRVLEARIHLSRTYLRTNATNWVRYVTPSNARSEIISFDRGGTFCPIELRLQAVPKRELLGSPRRGGKASGKLGKRRGFTRVADVRGGPA